MFMQKLGIVDTNANGGPKNRRVLLARLREGIRNDLECVANENQQRMMRMAGYWRYANKRTYNLMVEKNDLWDWETGAKLEAIDEEIEASEEGTSHDTNDSPTEVCLSQSESGNEALAGPSTNTITEKTSQAKSVTAETSLEAPECQKTSSEPVKKRVQAQSPYSGKADARHLQVTVPLVTLTEEKKHVPVEEAKASIEENLVCEKATTKAKEELNGSEEDVPSSPLQAKAGRKKSRSRSKNKSLRDQNNRFTALDGYLEEDWKTATASQADISPISTSRRSSVRSVANPSATIRPSPLRNVAAISRPAPDLSAFPELPSTKAAKLQVNVPHPPAHMTAQQAANFQTQLVGRGGRAPLVDYAAILRSSLDES